MHTMIKIVSTLLILATPVLHAADEDLKAGEKVYNKVCMMCHASGLAGAPKYGDSDAWAPRIEKGMDVLVGSVTNGLGAMPPKGSCTNCSDADLKAAVQYMVKAAE